ncbi:MAG TPA: pseudouridine synthase [Verrucomicrobiae bacterium]|nr:pseudouridine synthase [Verrucomicrobiae bacterium]
MSAPREPDERLNRHLARLGVASRREADRLIAEGLVQINGRPPSGAGARVRAGLDKITVRGRPLAAAAPPRVTLALNKPVGVVSTVRDPQGRPTVVDLVAGGVRVFPVGRLDLRSRGLVLLTNDGPLALRLTHPRYQVPKVYRVAISGRPTLAQLQRLERGVDLVDGPARALQVRPAGRWQYGARLDLTLAEGRQHEVRRLLAAVGLTVADLQRIAIGPLRLGSQPEGTVRELGPHEYRRLVTAAGPGP